MHSNITYTYETSKNSMPHLSSIGCIYADLFEHFNGTCLNAMVKANAASKFGEPSEKHKSNKIQTGVLYLISIFLMYLSVLNE